METKLIQTAMVGNTLDFIIEGVIRTIKGQGRNNYDLDNKNEYYDKTRDEQFREDLNYCIENEEQFRELLKTVLTDDEED